MADDEPVRVVEMLGDEYARRILVETSDEPKSVDALSAACDADDSTIYRRLERLQEANLVEDQQRIDPGGHHYKEYAALVDEIRVGVDAAGVDVAVERATEESPADRFTRLYEGLK